MPSPLLVTLCTYNEAQNLSPLIGEIQSYAPDADVLVIDDNSPDGTGRIAEAMSHDDPRIHVLHRPGKLGLGAATMAGFLWALDRGYEFVVNMDADFSHHPRYLPALRAGMPDVDVMIGSRYVDGGGVEGWGLHRHVMSRSINTYARLTLGLRTRDNSGSYRCYRTAILRQIDWSRFRARGYAFQEEVLYRCQALGARFGETPIVFEDRQRGRSKINGREVIAALWVMFRLMLDRFRGVPVARPRSTPNPSETTVH